MSHSFNKLWIHAIWATKLRESLIHPEIEKTIHQFLYDEFKDLGCPVRIINGMPDHVHCLFLLNPQKSIAEVIKTVKGVSSHIINQSNLMSGKFAWQTGYAAFSVSESQLEKIYFYIKNQKEHHLHKNFIDEYEGFLKKYGFDNHNEE
ncbi:IS200/IS605 family transposase [Amniculibacterium aquaticum]|uniref:IS200/IS605 family transposase n=1 Tax=Amniculibacterium aquaticum TaxID=2479858 RepID=UPI000F598202|nr:IS200/IS605 family transposase [Amniculibacterium aquaticum]